MSYEKVNSKVRDDQRQGGEVIEERREEEAWTVDVRLIVLFAYKDLANIFR